MSDFLPMYSVEAEMSALGSMLRSEGAAQELAALLVERDFYRPSHRLIFKAMRGLLADKTPIEFITLNERLKQEGSLTDIGGPDYLTELDLSTPSAANAAYYAGIVLDRAKLRQAEETGRKMVLLAHEGGTGAVEAIMAEAKSIGDRLSHGGFRVVEGDKASSIERVLARKRGGGWATGFPSIDERHCRQHRGLAKKQFTLVQALPGRGKSTTKLSMALPALDRGERGVIASFADLDEDSLTYRMIRYKSGFAGTLEECYDEAERKIVRDAADAVYGWNFAIYDASRSVGGNTIEGFRSWLARDADKNGNPDFVLMDYAQRIQTGDRQVMLAGPTAQNQYVSERVRLLAGEHDAAFLVGCQVTPKGKNGEGEMEYSAQHATDWDQHAALTILLLGQEKAKLTKNRYGTFNVTLDLAFLGGQQIVREVSH